MAAKTSDELMESFKKLATHMAEESKRTDKHWDDIANSIEKSSKSFDKGFLHVISKFTGLHGLVKDTTGLLASGITGSSKHLDGLLSKWMAAEEKAKSLHDPTRQRRSSEEVRAQELADKLQKKYEDHASIQEKISNIAFGRMGPAYAALAGSLALAYQYSHQINKDLIQASADTMERYRLMDSISDVQAKTGNEMKDMAKAAAALTGYGFDLKNNFKDTLSVVVKMEEGLGVSYETSAQMAVMMQRIGTNLKSVADVIARVKADTALSAEEASKFATEIGRAINMLKPGSGSMADQVIDYVDRLSGALKQVGGNAGDIKDLLVGMTQEKGMMGAATLGATPDFLSSPDGAKKVTERFVKYVNMQLAGTSGYQRMAVIQMLSQQFGTTADLIANADKMLSEYNSTAKHTTDLQQEWRNQTSDLGKVISKLAESGRAVMQRLLIPLFQLIRPVLAGVSDIVQAIASSTPALVVAGTLMLGVLSSAVIEFYALSRSLVAAALASKFFQTVSLGRGNVIANGGPILTTLKNYLPLITKHLGLIGVSAAAGVVAGVAFDKGLKAIGWDISELLKSETTKRMEYREQTMARRGNMSYSDVMGGVRNLISKNASAADIQAYLLNNAHKIPALSGSSDPEAQKRMISGLLASVGNAITTQRQALKYSGLTEASEEDKKRQQELIDLFKQFSANTSLQTELLKHAIKKHELNEERDRMDGMADRREESLNDTMNRMEEAISHGKH